MTELKGLAWNGVPDELRPIVWQLLLVRLDRPYTYPFSPEEASLNPSLYCSGLPSVDVSIETRGSLGKAASLPRSRAFGLQGWDRRSGPGGASRAMQSHSLVSRTHPLVTFLLQMWHQITIDIPRTRPNVPLWTMKPAQRVWPTKPFFVLFVLE